MFCAYQLIACPCCSMWCSCVNGITTLLLVLLLLLLLACGSIDCFLVCVVQIVSNISCRDVLCMLCFAAAVVVFHPPLHPMPSTITDAFCWHSLAPELSCKQSRLLLAPLPLSLPQLSFPLHHVHLHNQGCPLLLLLAINLPAMWWNVLCLPTNCLSLLLFRVMLMCQWYCNPPAGSAAAVAGLWFDWLLLCVCGTAGK
jgi:hypothetical protein